MIRYIEKFCWQHLKAALLHLTWKHARAAVAHPEHYAVAVTITAALLLLKHFDVAAIWCLWLDKLLTSITEG